MSESAEQRKARIRERRAQRPREQLAHKVNRTPPTWAVAMLAIMIGALAALAVYAVVILMVGGHL